MLKKIELFRPHSIVENYQDKGAVKIYQDYMEAILLTEKDGYKLPFETFGIPVQYTSMDDIDTVSDLFIKGI